MSPARGDVRAAVNPRPPLSVDPGEPHKILPEPSPEWLRRGTKREGNVEVSDKKFAASAKWGTVGIIAFAVVVVAFKWGPPSVSVDAQDRWTGNDQVRFETALAGRLDRMDRMIERLDTLIVSQTKIVDRLLTLTEKQDERIRALEDRAKR